MKARKREGKGGQGEKGEEERESGVKDGQGIFKRGREDGLRGTGKGETGRRKKE